jgi:hypothetical protein
VLHTDSGVFHCHPLFHGNFSIDHLNFELQVREGFLSEKFCSKNILFLPNESGYFDITFTVIFSFKMSLSLSGKYVFTPPGRI